MPDATTWHKRIDTNPEKYGVKASDVAHGRAIIKKVLETEAQDEARRVKREKKEMEGENDG